MATRKYPMNHRDGAEERPAPEPELFPWDKDSMIDELYARANRLMDEMSKLAEKYRWEPKTARLKPEPEETRAEPFDPDSVEDIARGILYGGPAPEEEEAPQAREISRKPLYAGPEFDVFGSLLPEKD